jgi:hypothetical protein
MKVDIRKVEEKSGNKAGKAWAMTVCSAIFTNEDGSEALGQFILPRDHPKVERGVYTASIGARETQKGLEFGIISLQVARPAVRASA